MILRTNSRGIGKVVTFLEKVGKSIQKESLFSQLKLAETLKTAWINIITERKKERKFIYLSIANIIIENKNKIIHTQKGQKMS